MNDVSIMFPLPQTATDIGSLLAPSATGARGILVPQALYTSVAELPGSTLTSTAPTNGLAGYSIASYDDLRVVSVRIDPCFAVMQPDPHGVGCPPQIRLVLQEVRATDGGAPQAFDSALHAIYSLPRNELLTLARKLVALRQANDAANDVGRFARSPSGHRAARARRRHELWCTKAYFAICRGGEPGPRGHVRHR